MKSGAWNVHQESLRLSLLARLHVSDREFAVGADLIARGESEYGDMSVRPCLTSALNMPGTALTELVSCPEGGGASVHMPFI